MRFLLDNNLSPALVAVLSAAGHDSEHVREHGMGSAPDEEVLESVRRNRRVLISADTDFGMLLARTGAPGPSVVLIRRSRARRAKELARLGQSPRHHLTDPALSPRLLGLGVDTHLDGIGTPVGPKPGPCLAHLFDPGPRRRPRPGHRGQAVDHDHRPRHQAPSLAGRPPR